MEELRGKMQNMGGTTDAEWISRICSAPESMSWAHTSTMSTDLPYGEVPIAVATERPMLPAAIGHEGPGPPAQHAAVVSPACEFW